jgi:phosphoglucosamine mutase
MDLKYFGTDGVRGKALVSPLSLEDTVRWGHAWAELACARGIEELVLGWDPRESSLPLARAFAEGVGTRLRLCVLGLIPTPAVAWVTSRRPGAWGLMISASHNPPPDNGIKGFDGQGDKLSEEDEFAIERAYEASAGLPDLEARAAASAALELPCNVELQEAYIGHMDKLDLPDDVRVVVDCAHGATAPWAHRIIRGAGVVWMGVPADGARINVGVGSTHMQALQEKVRELGAVAGIALDGDGDRCLLVDPRGEIVDGDQLLWLLARDLHTPETPVPGVVGTVMSNGGLEAALRGVGIPFARTAVGDKFMVRELARQGWDMAAEASGHIIQKHLGPSGDGLAASVAALRALLHRAPEERWDWRFKPWPLRLVNVVARNRRPIESCAGLQAAIETLEHRHGEALRMVIRWSGTEPKLRLMVEAREKDLMVTAIEHLEEAARTDLGIH